MGEGGGVWGLGGRVKGSHKVDHAQEEGGLVQRQPLLGRPRRDVQPPRPPLRTPAVSRAGRRVAVVPAARAGAEQLLGGPMPICPVLPSQSPKPLNPNPRRLCVAVAASWAGCGTAGVPFGARGRAAAWGCARRRAPLTAAAACSPARGAGAAGLRTELLGGPGRGARPPPAPGHAAAAASWAGCGSPCAAPGVGRRTEQLPGGLGRAAQPHRLPLGPPAATWAVCGPGGRRAGQAGASG